jgi:hypothetical protein
MNWLFPLVIFAFAGLVSVCVASGALPAFFGKNENGRSKHYWKLLIGGILLLVATTAIAFAAVFHTPEKAPKKFYKIPQFTEWYFVNPVECRKAMINEKAYSPETFARKNECDLEELDGVIPMTKVDCTKMLDNIFYMVEGDERCGQVHLMMLEQANKPAEE